MGFAGAMGDMVTSDGGDAETTRAARRWWVRAARMAALGLVLMVVGVVMVGVFFAKPWRTCEDDDARPVALGASSRTGCWPAWRSVLRGLS